MKNLKKVMHTIKSKDGARIIEELDDTLELYFNLHYDDPARKNPFRSYSKALLHELSNPDILDQCGGIDEAELKTRTDKLHKYIFDKPHICEMTAKKHIKKLSTLFKPYFTFKIDVPRFSVPIPDHPWQIPCADPFISDDYRQ